jgi:hypothetical protein
MIARAAPRGRRAFVLIAVLVVVTMLSYSAYTFTYWVSVEADTSLVEARQVQARYLAESGVALVEALAIAKSLGRPVPEPGNVPELFDGVSVPLGLNDDVSTGARTKAYGRFSVLAAVQGAARPGAVGEAAGATFGVSPEGARIHLNHWAQADPESLERALLALPNATPELVQAVLDWLDPDDDKRPRGAESEHYSELDPPIWQRNGPIESLEELLLVRGMTREILFGEVAEDAASYARRSPAGRGERPKGWAEYLTLYSVESNVDWAGRARINLNSEDLGLLYSALLEEFGVELARFVVARRVLGPSTPRPGQEFADEIFGPGRFSIGSVYDLVDAQVDGVWETQKVSLRSPLDSASADFERTWPRILDRTTTYSDAWFVGRLDLSSAEPEAMALAWLIPEELRGRIVENRPAADAIQKVEGREDDAPPDGATLAWLARLNLLNWSEMRQIEPVATSRSPVVRFRTVGYFDSHRTRCELEVVMDRRPRPCRFLVWRRLDRRGEGAAPVRRSDQPKDLPRIEDGRGG